MHEMAMTTMFHPLDGSFVKVIRRPGRGGYTPVEGSECAVVFNIPDQEVILPTGIGLQTGADTKYTIGEGDTDAHCIIDKCLISMKEDEMCGLMFPISNGKVVQKSENDGNNTFFTMEVHLLNFTRLPIYEMDEMAKLERGKHHKDKGSELFKDGHKEAAFRRYGLALKYVASAGPENYIPQELSESYRTLKTQIHLNIAACQLHYENFHAVITNCSAAIDADISNVKGFYRRGVAYSRIEDWQNAESDLRAVINLDPGNKAALRELHTVHHMLQEEREAEKVGQLARGMRQMFS